MVGRGGKRLLEGKRYGDLWKKLESCVVDVDDLM